MVGNSQPKSEQARKKEIKKIEDYRALVDLVGSQVTSQF